MKILVLNYEFPPIGGGASPVSYLLAKEYVAQGHEVDVITMSYKNLPSYEVKDGIHIYRVPCLRKKKEKSSVIELFSYLIPAFFKSSNLHQKKKYDICHCHFLVPTGMIALALKYLFNLNYLVSVHGSDVPFYNPNRFKIAYYFIIPIVKLVCFYSKNLVVGSAYLASFLKKFTSKKINVIPNFVDTKEYQPKKKQQIILAAGRLVEFKGFQHLIQAVSSKKNWPIYIAGAGSYEQKLKLLARTSQTKILFLGWQSKEQMKKLYAKASIFVLPSEKENSSLAILEAMASGCAIITTSSTGSAELVKGVGELIPYGNSQKISLAITKIQKDLKKYKHQSLKKSKELDINRITDKYLALLK